MRDIQKVMGALGSPVRREILRLIWDRELPAGQIADAFAVTAPTISQHLSVLRSSGLVSSRAVGTSRLYRARQEVLSGLRGALSDPGKWEVADDVPERALADAYTAPMVVASVEVPVERAAVFRAFTDGAVYSRWLSVPVSLVPESGWAFACTLEWGTQVRGRYELVVEPELIVMRWDFEDDAIPVPGGEMTAYLRLSARDGGTLAEVHQLVDTPAQAEFMEAAWTLVLGRLKSGLVRALDPDEAVAPRARRGKQRRVS